MNRSSSWASGAYFPFGEGRSLLGMLNAEPAAPLAAPLAAGRVQQLAVGLGAQRARGLSGRLANYFDAQLAAERESWQRGGLRQIR